MNESRLARKRLPWLRLIGVAIVWVALLLWGACYRMPYDLRISVFLWSAGSAAAAGVAFGCWKNGRAALRAQTWKNRWRPVSGILGLGFGMGFLVGIPLFGLLLGCNGTFRGTEPFVVDGAVVAKQMNSGRSTNYWVVVEEKRPGRTLRFNLDREAYQRISVGDRYHEEFQLGLFGWPCRSH